MLLPPCAELACCFRALEVSAWANKILVCRFDEQLGAAANIALDGEAVELADHDEHMEKCGKGSHRMLCKMSSRSSVRHRVNHVFVHVRTWALTCGQPSGDPSHAMELRCISLILLFVQHCSCSHVLLLQVSALSYCGCREP